MGLVDCRQEVSLVACRNQQKSGHSQIWVYNECDNDLKSFVSRDILLLNSSSMWKLAQQLVKSVQKRCDYGGEKGQYLELILIFICVQCQPFSGEAHLGQLAARKPSREDWTTLAGLKELFLLQCTSPGDLIDAVSVPSAPRQDYTAHWAKKSSCSAD